MIVKKIDLINIEYIWFIPVHGKDETAITPVFSVTWSLIFLIQETFLCIIIINVKYS